MSYRLTLYYTPESPFANNSMGQPLTEFKTFAVGIYRIRITECVTLWNTIYW